MVLIELIVSDLGIAGLAKEHALIGGAFYSGWYCIDDKRILAAAQFTFIGTTLTQGLFEGHNFLPEGDKSTYYDHCLPVKTGSCYFT